MIQVLEAPPYLTVQDLGRPGYRSQGVPASGAMDRWAFSITNVVVGNPPDAAALEWALGPGSIRIEGATAVAVGGASVQATLNGAPMASYRTYHASAGSVVAVDRLVHGRFAYLAVGGGLDAPLVLGSRSTYLPARFGGLEGRILRPGDRLALMPPTAAPVPDGFTLPADLEPQWSPVMRVVLGPHPGLFADAAVATLTTGEFTVTRASDRMGYRLSGPALPHRHDAALPSEPACAGAIQVPSSGQPIVLMADGPTVGGYPVIGVVCAADLPALTQRVPGEPVRFEVIDVRDAQRALRRRAAAIHTAAYLSQAATAH